MNKLIIALIFLLSACGGSSSTPTVEPPVIEPPVVKDTLLIYKSTDYTSLTSVSNAIYHDDFKAVIVHTTYDKAVHDTAQHCPGCFELTNSVILGEDPECTDCLRLNTFLDYSERDHSVKVFVVIEDSLSFAFAEQMISQRGYSDIVLVSSNEELLLSARYNYELAMIGEPAALYADWIITTDSDCSAKCINPNGEGAGVFDGVIYP
jgi:hypothetical protein